MHLWMYLVVIGMILFALVATVWVTLWTIQRGEKARAAAAERARVVTRPSAPATPDLSVDAGQPAPPSVTNPEIPATDSV
jgi:hypothetical protein